MPSVRTEDHFLSAEQPSGPPPAPLARAQLGMLRIALYPYIMGGNILDPFQFAIGLALISSAGAPRDVSQIVHPLFPIAPEPCDHFER